MSKPVPKFRHVHAEVARPDAQFRDIRPANTVWDCSNFLAANSKYFAMAWHSGGGGKLAILDLNKPGRVSADNNCISGHQGPILDWEFHPFADNIIASTSEDCTAKVWGIPEEGLTTSIDSPLITLTGHSRKVGICHFHHVANHVLITAGMDHLIKFWDIEVGEKLTLDLHKDQIFSFDLNLEGNMIATCCKDKKLRIIDPRGNGVAAETTAHAGNKTQKAIWAKRRDRIVTCGFSKTQERQLYLWDPRKLDAKLFEEDIDNGSAALMMFYDEDVNMLYLAGKGDASIRYYELWDNQPPVYFLSNTSPSNPQKGLCMLPKIACDTTQCEVAKFLRLENQVVVPLSFQCPRKQASTEFQADVYPDTFSNVPAMSAADYFGGATAPPNTISMEHCRGKTGTSMRVAPISEAPVPKVDIQSQQQKVEKLRKELAAEEAILAQMEEEFAKLSAS